MDIQGTESGPEKARRTFEQHQRALIDANRAIVRAARGRVEMPEVASRQDEIELSAAARALQEPSHAEREAHVRELTEAHRLARLHTPERLERAAQRLLEGS